MAQTSKGALAALGAVFRPELYKALCDPNRVALVTWLAAEREPRSVTEIARSGCCSVDLSVISRHLATLRGVGILESTRRGKEVLYSFRAEMLVTALRSLADALESSCLPKERSE
jgi:DNA-binding transcriptional ArsR family regulator